MNRVHARSNLSEQFATDNAGKMISDLTLKVNHERQAAITKEILEVVDGGRGVEGLIFIA